MGLTDSGVDDEMGVGGRDPAVALKWGSREHAANRESQVCIQF